MVSAKISTPVRGPMLPVLLAGTFMISLDFFIVNVAIPSIQRDLAAEGSAIQFVVSFYALGYGAFLITAGRIGDLLGRRRIYAVGMALFTTASAACGLSGSATFLVAVRALQGIGAALMAPQVLAIISTTYSMERRGRAFAAYAITLGVAGVLGQFVGGILIRIDPIGLGWRSCFLINVPVGLASLLLLRTAVPESRASDRTRLDLGGMLLVTAALLAVVVPLIEGRARGWPPWSWLVLASSVPLLALLWLYERRLAAKGHSPLIDMSLFGDRAFASGLVAQILFWTGQASYFLILAIYLQNGRGLDPLRSGLMFGLMGVGYLAASAASAPLGRRLGKHVISIGGILQACGLGLLAVVARLDGNGAAVLWLAPALVVDGVGMGLAIAPLASTVLSRVQARHAGAAAGVLTTGIQVGNALGVALIGIVASGDFARSIPVDVSAAFVRGLVFLIGLGVSVAVASQFMPDRLASKES